MIRRGLPRRMGFPKRLTTYTPGEQLLEALKTAPTGPAATSALDALVVPAAVPVKAPERQEEGEIPGKIGPYKVLVEGLPFGASEEDVQRVMTMEIEGEDIAPFAIQFFQERQRGNVRQLAFAFFPSETDAQRVLSRAQKFGVYVHGQRCALYPASRKKRLFLGNLDFSIRNEAQLRFKLCQLQHFPHEDCVLTLGDARGFAFLDFPSHDEALAAYDTIASSRADPDLWGLREPVVRWASGSERTGKKGAVPAGKEMAAQIKRLQSENYRLRLEKTELELQMQTLQQSLQARDRTPEEP